LDGLTRRRSDTGTRRAPALSAQEFEMSKHSAGVKVPLYDSSEDNPDRSCIGRVTYTSNLDYWDGNNYTCGSTGHHLGVGKTRNGRYFLVHGTQWQGERDYAEIVTEAEAKSAVMARDDDALYQKLFGENIPDLDSQE
jgi:hypothetical protein